MQFLYGVDLVVEEVQHTDSCHALEGAAPDDAEIGLLYREHADVSQAFESAGLERGQVHEGEFEETYGIQAVESRRFQGPDPWREREFLHVGQTAEGVALELDYRVVGEHEQFKVAGAGEGKVLDLFDTVVAEVDGSDVLEGGEGEGRDGRERGLLDGYLPESGWAPERERLYDRYVVAV